MLKNIAGIKVNMTAAATALNKHPCLILIIATVFSEKP